MKLRIATRGSDLALAQAYYVQDRIRQLTDAPETEIKIIKTTGDKIQNVPLSQVDTGETPDERKGFFTKEIEDALLNSDAEIAVHSFKDLPTIDVPGLSIASMPQRLTPFDILLIPKNKKVGDSFPFLAPGSKIGTSSVRRISQIEFRWPKIETVDLRGNVPTRINRLLDGDTYDGILLSGAGFERLMTDGSFERIGLKDRIVNEIEVVTIPPDEFVPAPAQGALALQCRVDDEMTKSVLDRLHDESAAKAVRAERAVLKAVEGGCHLPLGAYARQREDGYFELHVYLGKEAVDNTTGKSYYKVRSSQDSDELAKSVIEEIKKKSH